MQGTYFSSVVLNQNANVVTPIALLNSYYYQTFRFPSGYTRGIGAEKHTPELTGVQILVTALKSTEFTSGLTWTVGYYQFGVGWVTVDTGTTVGVHATGSKLWFDIYFDDPIVIPDDLLTSEWRFGIRGQNIPLTTVSDIVPYLRPYATVDGRPVYADLQLDTPFAFIDNGLDQILLLDSNDGLVHRTYQYGITQIWTSSPNPLAADGARLYSSDGITPVSIGGNVSLAFRLLSNVAEDGVDFLGNQYRSVVTKNSSANVSTLDSEVKDKFWLSKPNPSRFGVECLYFDLTSASGEAQVVDRVLVDPLTLGTYFQVYYTNEGSPGKNETEWDDKLWKRIEKTFGMHRKETHVLPEPIYTKYIKIEFTHLQAQSYAAGEFQEPVSYKKHPSWVLDYFLIRTEFERQRLRETSARTVGIVYSALDLAYNYYTDDLTQTLETPASLTPIITTETDNVIDPDLLAQIDLAFRPYRRHPVEFGKADYLLTTGVSNLNSNYPIEQSGPNQTYDQSILGQKRDDAVIFESTQPVLYFYINCRHRYKHVKAKLANDKAYFVGIKQIGFSRDNYTVAHDSGLYIESVSDNQNLVRNDFVQTEDNIWTIG